MQQISNPHSQQSLNSLNSYHMSGSSPANIMYEPTLLLPLGAASQSHEMNDMREYIHMEKPPMYPGHSGGQQQQEHTMPAVQNSATGAYVHSTHLDPIEQALSKGDWSGVSDRSLLLYALQVFKMSHRQYDFYFYTNLILIYYLLLVR